MNDQILKETSGNMVYVLWKFGNETTVLAVRYIDDSGKVKGFHSVSSTFGYWVIFKPKHVYGTHKEAKEALQKGVQAY